MPPLSFPLLPDQTFVVLTQAQLQTMLVSCIDEALTRHQTRELAQKRLPSRDAAAFLGCTTGHLAKLHKRGLPYEKGKPNYYKFGDLEDYRAKSRLQLSQ